MQKTEQVLILHRYEIKLHLFLSMTENLSTTIKFDCCSLLATNVSQLPWNIID